MIICINAHVYRTGWCWDRWMWMFWWRDTFTAFRTGRETLKLLKPKEKKLNVCPGKCFLPVFYSTACLKRCAIFTRVFCVCSTEKVDCVTVNCEPVRVAVDDLIQRLFDALLSSLRRSIQGEIRNTHNSWPFEEFGLDGYCRFRNNRGKCPF